MAKKNHRRAVIEWLLALAFAAAGECLADVPVVMAPGAAPPEQLAVRDLADALARLYPKESFPISTNLPRQGRCILVGNARADARVGSRVKGTTLDSPESFAVTTVSEGERQLGIIAGADARGTAYGVYALLQKLGCGYQLAGDTFPAPSAAAFSFDAWRLADRPLLGGRLVFNWHNFLSGCSTWNLEDWQRWTTQSLKLGYNAIMVHAYGNNPMAGFEFNGLEKPVGYLSTTVKGRDWSTMHVNDVRRLYGGGGFLQPVFGATAAQVPDAQRTAAVRRLMRGVFEHARQRGVRVFFAVDVDTASANPPELIGTLPESARFPVRLESLGWMGQEARRLWLANPDTPEGYRYYQAQVNAWLREYPALDCLVVWFRRDRTPWMGFAPEEMPAAWQREYQAELSKTPGAKTYWHGHNLFALAKIIKACQRALREAGQSHTSVAFGTWSFSFLPAADRYLPPEVALIGLDYEVLHDRPILDQAPGRQSLRQAGQHRPVIPVVWAHHDDGNYVGRPYRPFNQFCGKLEESGAGGFGIIHWTTRPLDLFFTSLSRQTWASTRDEPLDVTCGQVAERWFSPGAREPMGRYLEQWITGAPKFGRETSDWFIDHPLTNVMEVVAGCRERLRLLDTVDAGRLPPAARATLDYFKGLETFILSFHEHQQRFQESQARWKAGDLAGARAAIQECNPGSVIEHFARFSSLGGITRGEQGLIVSLNTRWLAHIVRHRQHLGLEAVRINFAPTSHDPLAQAPGRATYHVEPDHTLWECRGERETGAAVFGVGETEAFTLAAGLPEAWRELFQAGVAASKPFQFTLPEVVPGAYRLRVLLRDPEATAPEQNVFDLSFDPPASDTVWTFEPVVHEYFRVACRGNSENDWNSLTEVKLDGVARRQGRPLITASGAVVGFSPEKAMDGNLQTRWAAQGRDHWLQFQLDPGVTTRRIGLHWFRASERQPRFELLTSADGRTWAPVRGLSSAAGAAPAIEHVDIFQRAGRRNHGIELSRDLSFTTAGALRVSVKPVKGRAALCGVVLEPVR